MRLDPPRALVAAQALRPHVTGPPPQAGPPDRAGDADPEPLRRLASRQPAIDCRNHPLAKTVPINARRVPNAPRPNRSRRAVRPSRFARWLNARPSNARLLSVRLLNAFSV